MKEEDALQVMLCKHLTEFACPGVVWWHTPNGGHRHVAEATKLKRMGTKRGVPDLLFLKDGRLYGLELKATKGKLSSEQEMFSHLLMAAGAAAWAVARSFEEALAWLQVVGMVRGRTIQEDVGRQAKAVSNKKISRLSKKAKDHDQGVRHPADATPRNAKVCPRGD